MTRPARTAEARNAVLAHLEASATTGAAWAEIRAALGITESAGACILSRLTRYGILGYVTERNPARARGEAMVRRRYFMRHHCPPNAALQPLSTDKRIAGLPGVPAKPLPVQGRGATAVAQAPKRKPAAPALDPLAPAIVPSSVKVTICPSGADQRFTVHTVTEPLFSALGLGRYLNRDTAISRAYG